MRAWCSWAAVPVPASMVAAWGEASDVDAFALFDGDDMVAYGEVWTDDDEAETELAHVIVAPDHRGRGVGVASTRLLAARAATIHADVVLRVRPGNDAALRCYAGAGFVRMAPELEWQCNVGQPVDYVWMQRALVD